MFRIVSGVVLVITNVIGATVSFMAGSDHIYTGIIFTMLTFTALSVIADGVISIKREEW